MRRADRVGGWRHEPASAASSAFAVASKSSTATNGNRMLMCGGHLIRSDRSSGSEQISRDARKRWSAFNSVLTGRSACRGLAEALGFPPACPAAAPRRVPCGKLASPTSPTSLVQNSVSPDDHGGKVGHLPGTVTLACPTQQHTTWAQLSVVPVGK